MGDKEIYINSTSDDSSEFDEEDSYIESDSNNSSNSSDISGISDTYFESFIDNHDISETKNYDNTNINYKELFKVEDEIDE